MTRLALLNRYSDLNAGDEAIYAAYAAMAADAGACVLVPPGLLKPLECLRGKDQGYDAYLSAGGDVWNNARPWFVTRSFLANLRTLRCSPAHRTFVFGQSLPASCRGLSFALLARTLRRVASVHVRDAESHARLTGAGVPAHLSYDAAFALALPEGGLVAARAAFQRIGVDPARAALLSGRPFNAMYPVGSERAFSATANLAERLARRGHQPVFLIQAMVDAHDEDLSLARRLRAAVPSLKVMNAFRARNEGVEPWALACGATALARIVVGVRFHTAVFRLLAGRSAFVAYYSQKGRDLVERLGQPGCAIDALDADAQIGAIEASAEAVFDIHSVRRRVRADFRGALRAALPAAAAVPAPVCLEEVQP